MLNGWFTEGRGWESAAGQNNQILQQVQNTQPTRRSDLPAQNGLAPPSPALVLPGSQKGQFPPGTHPMLNSQPHPPAQFTPRPSDTGHNFSTTLQKPMMAQQNGHDSGEGLHTHNATYGRVSPMLQSTQVPLATSHMGNQGNSEQENGPQKFSLWKILTCKCL